MLDQAKPQSVTSYPRINLLRVGEAASLGFEPRQRDSESLVLPLHYEARVSEQLKASYTRAQPLRHSRKNLTLVENVEIRMTKLEGMTNA